MPTPAYTSPPAPVDNILAYLKWRGDLSFSDAPFCEVDNLILSMVCYLNFEEIVPSGWDDTIELATAVSEFMHLPEAKQYIGAIIPPDIVKLAKMVTSCRRFAGTQVAGFINEVDEERHIQFCALTYLLPDETLFIAFRGTDDNIVGWKEDFMLAFITPVPAQIHAVEYLEQAAGAFPDHRFRVGGHSKGGNLSFYAAVHVSADVQKRLIRAFSNDGPGFMPEFFTEPGYAAVEKRLMTYVPQSSIVGALLHQPKHCSIIHSTQKNILQHDPFSWVVCGAHFVYARNRSAFGARADVTLDRWIMSLSLEERRIFTQNLFGIITASGAKTLSDIVSDKLRSARVIISSFARLSKQDREIMIRIVHLLLQASRESAKYIDEPQSPALPAASQKGKKEDKKAKDKKAKEIKPKQKKKPSPKAKAPKK